MKSTFVKEYINKQVEYLMLALIAYAEDHEPEEVKSFFVGGFMTIERFAEDFGINDSLAYLAPLVQEYLDEYDLPITIGNLPDYEESLNQDELLPSVN